MRLFVGTFLSPHNQDFYHAFVGALVRRHRDVLRSVPDGSAHLTYAFIPDLDEALVGRLLSRIGDAARHRRAFDIELSTPIVLRAGTRPRLVCAELASGAEDVGRLAAELSGVVSAMAPDVRPSKAPHVTLARFRKNATRADGDAVSKFLSPSKCKVDRVSLVQVVASVLTPSGPVYATRGEAPLGAAGHFA
jgi:2'-5' RNA ligase